MKTERVTSRDAEPGSKLEPFRSGSSSRAILNLALTSAKILKIYADTDFGK